MQRKLLYTKRHIVIVLLALLLVPGFQRVEARSGYRSAADGVGHYLTFSLLGGEANTFVTSSDRVGSAPVAFHTGFDVVNMPGGDAQFELNYELKKRAFFFSIGGHVHYTITGQKLGTFSDTYRCIDVNGDPMDYSFNYSDYLEYQQTVMAGGVVRFGAFIHPNFYFALGAKFEYPVWNTYKARAGLSTSGCWPFALGGVQSAPGENSFDYGFFSEGPFVYQDQYMKAKQPFFVSPCAEIGTRFHLGGRAHMRVAAYVEYAIPIGALPQLPVADYSNVRVIPDYSSDIPAPAPMRVAAGNYPPSYWQNREELWSTLRLNSVLDFAGQDRIYNRLSVGIKLAFMINLNGVPQCTTCNDDSGIRYTQPKKIRKPHDTKINAR